MTLMQHNDCLASFKVKKPAFGFGWKGSVSDTGVTTPKQVQHSEMTSDKQLPGKAEMQLFDQVRL